MAEFVVATKSGKRPRVSVKEESNDFSRSPVRTTINEESEQISTQDPPPKRKRGRPPKPKPPIDSSEQPKIKRKRGRPAKLKTSTERKQESIPKKRGRPPKKPKLLLDEEVSAVSLTFTDEITSDSFKLNPLLAESLMPQLDEKVAKKKRGRPRKVTTPIADSHSLAVDPKNHISLMEAVTAGQDHQLPPVKRKRGRPRKPKTADALAIPLGSVDQNMPMADPQQQQNTVKRKSGRLQKTEANASSKPQPQTSSGTIVKRGRGRPRKIKPIEEQVSIISPAHPPNAGITSTSFVAGPIDHTETDITAIPNTGTSSTYITVIPAAAIADIDESEESDEDESDHSDLSSEGDECLGTTGGGGGKKPRFKKPDRA